MYGEPCRIRAIAERLESRAAQLREEAEALVAASEGVPWVSLAADRMREQSQRRREELRDVARGYDEAAERVRAHAAEVQRLLDLIAAIEAQARSLVAAAADRVQGALADVAAGLQDALTPGERADRWLAELAVPPPGHRDWLQMPDLVPGISA